MEMKLTFRLFAAMLVAPLVLLQGCISKTAVTSQHGFLRPYHKPLEGWDEQVLKKYTAGSLAEYAKQELAQMGFLTAYEIEFPAGHQAVAFASVKSQRAYEASAHAEAEYAAADAKVARLTERVAAEKSDVTALLGSTSESKVARLVELKSALKESVAELKKAEADRDEKENKRRTEAVAYTAASAEFQATFLRELFSIPFDGAVPASPRTEEELSLLRFGVLVGLVSESERGFDLTLSPGALDVEDWEAQTYFDSFGVAYLGQMTSKRNQILNELLTLAIAVHKARDHVLVYGRAKSNIVFDGIQIAATGVASVTGSEQAARSLAAFATGIAGIKESVDKELFFQQNTTALLQMMEADRANHLKPLIEGMARDADLYSLEQGLSDYVGFLTAGGLTDAVRDLSKEAAESARESNSKLEELKKSAAANLTHLEELEKKEAERRAAETEKRRANIEAILQPYLAGTPLAP